MYFRQQSTDRTEEPNSYLMEEVFVLQIDTNDGSRDK